MFFKSCSMPLVDLMQGCFSKFRDFKSQYYYICKTNGKEFGQIDVCWSINIIKFFVAHITLNFGLIIGKLIWYRNRSSYIQIRISVIFLFNLYWFSLVGECLPVRGSVEIKCWNINIVKIYCNPPIRKRLTNAFEKTK